MTTEAIPGPDSSPSYPVRLVILRPQSQSRITNFPLFIGTFIRMILLIPHFIVIFFLAIAWLVVTLIAQLVILFTGRYPQGLFNFAVGYNRWAANLGGYIFHLYDGYPPFSMDMKADYPLVLEVDYPEKLNRILNFPYIGSAYIKPILCIPHIIILFFLVLIAFLLLFIGQFAILFTGSFPAGMHSFLVGTQRWSTRVNAYIYALTDKYPPFSLN
jgi:hypothetical protein